MNAVSLTISEPKGTRQVPLNPQGTVLGRGSNCDVILEDDNVSRMHARIYQDPFGRWIVEDLDSHNGVLVEGQRVQAQAVLPGQIISISHFKLCLFEKPDHKSIGMVSAESTITVVDKGLNENIVSYRADQTTVLSPALVHHLNDFTEYLLKLSNPSDLYNLACMRLANVLNTLVAIVRLPCNSDPLPRRPEILVCHFGPDTADAAVVQTSGLHLSKRVLDAARSTDAPVMATSGASDGEHMMLTVVDEYRPHVVFAARVNDLGETIDILYIDIMEEKSPERMFDFVEAVARQVNFVQKNLFFVELQKQEKAAREANALLKEKDRIKDEYVARVTHDIKGHLAAIQSCLYVTADDHTGPLNDKQSEYLNRARNRNDQLSNFVAELLRLTKMRLSGKIQAAPFSLAETISKALAAVDRKARDKSISLTSDVDSSIGQIVGDEFSINEVITNLLFNAMKYTPNDKSVHLEARGFDDSVQIDITDTGIGIPANEVANIFDEFFRASNAREQEGTGLGLSIVHQIIKRHGGQISAQSKLGEGTKLTIILPKNPFF